jgi:hypothetical protein
MDLSGESILSTLDRADYHSATAERYSPGYCNLNGMILYVTPMLMPFGRMG